MRDLAQTNVQLCRQLVGLGWADDDLVRLRRAYELAMALFTGQFRANGKTQLAHHVGVASALADVGERPAVVVGGLVHSAYFLGEFGDGRLGPNADKRARVAAAVGAEVEALVAEYTDLTWDAAEVRTLVANAARQSPATRDVVAMRLANEVDEHADASQRLTAESPGVGLDGAEGLARFDELARAAGLARLGDLLRDAAELGAATPVPGVLVSTSSHTEFVAPASYRRRIHVALQDSRLGHEVAVRVPGARSLAERIRRAVS
jgi:hypothetical protein